MPSSGCTNLRPRGRISRRWIFKTVRYPDSVKAFEALLASVLRVCGVIIMNLPGPLPLSAGRESPKNHAGVHVDVGEWAFPGLCWAYIVFCLAVLVRHVAL